MISTSIVLPVLSPVVRGVLEAAQPNRLFAAGEQGVWYEPSDFSTLFQDSAGTTPVTAVGQPVGLMLDKSGRGNHAFQTTTGKRPVLEVDTNGHYYLKGDATAGRAMVTNSITPGADKVQVFAGLRKLSDAARGVVVELGPNNASINGAFVMDAPGSSPASERFRFVSKGTTAVILPASGSYAAPVTSVLTGLSDISGDSTTIRVNGTQAGRSTADQGTGNYLSYPLYLFARNQSEWYYTGRLYGLIVRFGPNLNAVTIMDIERYMAGKTGIMF